jgi:fucose permease
LQWNRFECTVAENLLPEINMRTISRTPFIAVSFIGMMMIGVTTTLIGPAFPLIMRELTIPFDLLGFLASAWSLGYLATSIGGELSDRYSEIVIMGTSFLITGAAMGLVLVVPNYCALVGVFLLGGVGTAFAEVAVNPLISKLFEDRPGFALNILHVFYGVGAFAGPVFATIVITQYGSWRLPYLAVSLVFVPLFVTAAILSRKLRQVAATSLSAVTQIECGDRGVREILRAGNALIVAGFFYLGAEIGITAWLPTFLTFEKSYSLEFAGLCMSLFWAAMAGGRLSLASFTDRFGYENVIITCSTLAAAMIFAGVFVRGWIFTVTVWSLSGFLFGPIFPTILASASRLFPGRKGFATGVVYSCSFLGAVLAPWLAGVVAKLYSLSASIIYLALSSLAVALSLLLMKLNMSVLSNSGW